MPFAVKRKSTKTDAADGGDGGDSWKAKYYSSLDTLEEHETTWTRLETELNSHLSQLALVLYGAGDPTLDTLLEKVRACARKGGENGRLGRLIEQLHEYRSNQELDMANSAIESTALVRQLLERLNQRVPGLTRIGQALSANPEAKQASVLVNEASEALLAATKSSAPDAEPALTANDVLSRLVEKLDVPEDMQARIDEIRKSLSQPITRANFPAIVATVASLVAELRRQLQAQRVEIEGFLLSVHRRLGDIGATLRETERAIGKGDERAQELSAGVNDEVAAMRTDLDRAVGLADLKDTVARGLENISIHVEHHVRAEAKANAQLNGQVTELKGTIARMDGESTELRELLAVEKTAAQTDGLTGLFNRAAFDERLAKVHNHAKQQKGRFSLLIWDIDLFKRINDTFGHQAGDKVLRAVAQMLRSHVRETDFVARYGGEEMAVLMPNANKDVAFRVAEQLRTALDRARFRYSDKSVHVTASCGLCESDGSDTPESVFKRADTALYEAKAQGRNRTVVA